MRKKRKPFLDPRERTIALALSCLASICLLCAIELIQAFSKASGGKQLFFAAVGNPITTIENKITDFWQRSRNADDKKYESVFGNVPGQIIILCIDSETIDHFGPPPYPRRVYARVLRVLREAGAKTVGLDITFFGNSSDPEDDRLFARELKHSPNVTLASFLKQTQQMAVEKTGVSPAGKGETWSIGMVEEKPIYANQERRVIHDDQIGFANYDRPDADDLVRQVPITYQVEDKLRLSFALNLARQYLGLSSSQVHRSDRYGHVDLGAIQIPLHPDTGLLVVNYARKRMGLGKLAFQRDSFLSFLDPTISEKDLVAYCKETYGGRIVLIGHSVTERGLADNVMTPFGIMSGVEAHAHAITTILSKALSRQLPGVDTGVLLGMGCLLGLVLSRLSPWTGVGIICLLELVVFFSYRELYYRGYHLSVFQTMLGILWSLIVLIFYFHHVSEKRHKRIDNVFGQFMSDKVKDKIMQDFDQQVAAGSLGETRYVTVIESDIRGFTSMSEKLTSEEVVRRLNVYFERMIPILFKYEGTYDKFVGDALLAYFGAPIPDPEHAKHAVLCSLEMQEAVEELRRQGILDIQIGIGVNTGDVTVGSIGARSARVVQYTIIGDTVNLAARLCSVAERGEVIISSYTYDLCKEAIEVESREPVKVKGKTDPIPIFRALSPKVAEDGNNVPKGGVLSEITKQ